MPILLPVIDNCPSWISERERMTRKHFMFNLNKRMVPDLKHRARDLLTTCQRSIGLSYRAQRLQDEHGKPESQNISWYNSRDKQRSLSFSNRQQRLCKTMWWTLKCYQTSDQQIFSLCLTLTISSDNFLWPMPFVS